MSYWSKKELMQKTFTPFGPIQEIRVFKDKGYAFVRFATKEAATHAIVATHNVEVNGQTVKCSWGKEAGDPNNQQQQQVGLSLKQEILAVEAAENKGFLTMLSQVSFLSCIAEQICSGENIVRKQLKKLGECIARK
ncbi:nucleolysin TIA-1 isoform p40 [Caerostris darwini]|uniref:Nucleolysin TIA-1 isoform p40 n=1 Tax=Caerostris darwini TaxID=1538125 RepID=A0AAV4WKT0_9ARAC|nr:nucleolysin TIA-1 isoform p40 [Caerostris darwini]